jgi:hypothetical protein
MPTNVKIDCLYILVFLLFVNLINSLIKIFNVFFSNEITGNGLGYEQCGF